MFDLTPTITNMRMFLPLYSAPSSVSGALSAFHFHSGVLHYYAAHTTSGLRAFRLGYQNKVGNTSQVSVLSSRLNLCSFLKCLVSVIAGELVVKRNNQRYFSLICDGTYI